jgi:hypothetical protein
VLKYCRNRLAGLPEDENETEFGAVVDFIEHHNQSLDWLFRGDPVTLITMMAARSSGALAGAGVERERSAYAAYLATDAVQDQVSDRCPFPERKLDRRGQKKLLARPEYKAWWARYQKAEKAHPEVAQTLWSARTDLLKTQPTSVPGLRAFIDHIEGPLSTGEAGEAFWDEQEREVAFPTLAAATRNIIARGQA